MPERNNPDQEQKRSPFIREKIAKPPMSKKQAVGRFLMFVLIAVIGGGAAGVSFAVARPLAERYLVPEPEVETSPVVIPRDEPETTAPSEPETAPSAEKETESEAIEELVQSAVAEYEYSAEDLGQLYQTLRMVAQDVDKGIVEVHSVKNETDWFNNPLETSGYYGGAVIASTSQEFLILTPCEAVEQADSVKVKFGSNTEVGGTIQETDRFSGMAIVSVEKKLLDETVREQVKVLTLGNSYTVKQGDLILALGAPAGLTHSSAYGFVSYVLRNVQVEDGITRLLYADLPSDAGSGTFLFNIDGELIGLVTDAYGHDDSQGMTVAMAISDYKTMLEKMSNGVPVPYLGIRGQEVTAAMAGTGMPLGLYVTDCMAESPAYSAGIQSGDVIILMGDKAITTMRDYQNQMEALKESDEIAVTVKRKGMDEYIELTFQVIVGAR